MQTDKYYVSRGVCKTTDLLDYSLNLSGGPDHSKTIKMFMSQHQHITMRVCNWTLCQFFSVHK